MSIDAKKRFQKNPKKNSKKNFKNYEESVGEKRLRTFLQEPYEILLVVIYDRLGCLP
jgi:hypothetical protein